MSFDDNQQLLTSQQTLKYIQQRKREKKSLALITDFDYTISLPHEDPRLSKIDETCKKALQKLSASGVHIGIISSRAASTVSRLTSALPNISIIGSGGWESYIKNDHKESQYYVHKSFHEIRNELNKLLYEVHLNLSTLVGVNAHADTDAEILLKTPDGNILLERKGIHPEFPEGIIHTYNLNTVDPLKRTIYGDNIAISYETAMQKIEMKSTIKSSEKLKAMCTLHIPNDLSKPGKVSIHLSPHISLGKSYAIKQYFYTPEDTKRDELFERIPGGFDTIIYSGDSDEDGYAFSAGKEAVRESMTDQTFFGIWVKPGIYDGDSFIVEKPQPIAAQYADLSLNGVAEYSSFLVSLAELLV